MHEHSRGTDRRLQREACMAVGARWTFGEQATCRHAVCHVASATSHATHGHTRVRVCIKSVSDMCCICHCNHAIARDGMGCWVFCFAFWPKSSSCSSILELSVVSIYRVWFAAGIGWHHCWHFLSASMMDMMVWKVMFPVLQSWDNKFSNLEICVVRLTSVCLILYTCTHIFV